MARKPSKSGQSNEKQSRTKRSTANRKDPANGGLPRNADGSIAGGPGRKKGVPNKISGQAKENIALVFEGLGGTDQMLEWARKNQAVFYSQIYTKLIPVMVKADIEATLNVDSPAATALERVLTNLFAARRAGTEKDPVVIDNEPEGGAVPQLVISGPRGSKAA